MLAKDGSDNVVLQFRIENKNQWMHNYIWLFRFDHELRVVFQNQI